MKHNKTNKKINTADRTKSDTNTGWGNVATWYDGHLKDDDTYHAKVIVPNLTRLVALKTTESLLELGCGQGYVLEKFLKYSTNLTGVDIGTELVEIAKKNNPKISYHTASADDQRILEGEKFDAIIIVLALQNMKNLSGVVDNVSRLLKKEGRAYLVLNHPAFRIPQNSDWLFDDKKGVQARRVDRYMSEIEISIDMTPGRKADKEMTRSFHRPLQVYSKAFGKQGFAITKIEEWISHKESQKGPRAAAENAARKEFPMFMCLELRRFAV
jgi:ubiquinone/menaquinone biosynthesis C-methylase UbiE